MVGTGPAVSPRDEGKGNDHAPRYRQQGLFVLVAAALDADDALGIPFDEVIIPLDPPEFTPARRGLHGRAARADP